MINKLGKSSNIPTPIGIVDPTLSNYLLALVRALTFTFQGILNILNSIADQMNAPTEPVLLPTYLKAALPDAAANINGMIIVSNDVGGLTPAFSDGTNWRRTADRAVIS